MVWNMQNALILAQKAYKENEVPVGAIVLNKDGLEVASAYNLKEKNLDSSAHAEILALKEASQKTNGWRLTGHTLFVTLEPCIMCLSAISQFRINKLIFGAYDPKAGSISLGYNIHNDPRLNHKFDIIGGILHYQSSQLLSQFFKERRKTY
jgi:tRNA(adenine34) deaminase